MNKIYITKTPTPPAGKEWAELMRESGFGDGEEGGLLVFGSRKGKIKSACFLGLLF